MWLRARACQEVLITPIFARPSTVKELFQIISKSRFSCLRNTLTILMKWEAQMMAPTPRRIIAMRHAENSNPIPTGSESAAWFFPPCHLPMPCLWARIAHVWARGRKGTIRECVPNRYLLKHLPIGRPSHMCWNEPHTRESKKSLSLKNQIIFKEKMLLYAQGSH